MLSVQVIAVVDFNLAVFNNRGAKFQGLFCKPEALVGGLHNRVRACNFHPQIANSRAQVSVHLVQNKSSEQPGIVICDRLGAGFKAQLCKHFGCRAFDRLRADDRCHGDSHPFRDCLAHPGQRQDGIDADPGIRWTNEHQVC